VLGVFIKIKKGFQLLRTEGLIRGTKIIIKKIKQKKLNVLRKKDIFSFLSFVNITEQPTISEPISEKGKMRLCWFIPDFGIGSGGHLNIFRFIHLLEKLGHSSDIVVIENSQWGDPANIKEVINKYFFPVQSNVYVIKSSEINGFDQRYDIAFATSWQTAYFLKGFKGAYRKAYFVQDFEPYFYPKGSYYSLAEQTYRFGYYGVTAGTWLKELLETNYQMECYSFSFSYDQDLYKLNVRREPEIRRLFFYSRPPTDRRGFEIGLLALQIFASRNPDVEIVMAGWDVSEYEIPFKHFNAGVVKIEELSMLYSQCDCALILSFTNLSLLPLELLASGCPVVINDGPNNSWIDPDKKLFIYTKEDIYSIANTLDHVMNNREYYQKLSYQEFQKRKQHTWEKEAQKLAFNLLEMLEK